MIEKKIKLEVPKTIKCSRCKDRAKVNDLKLTTDDILIVSYICDCGYENVIEKMVDFV